jgi:hypothetical protein
MSFEKGDDVKIPLPQHLFFFLLFWIFFLLLLFVF